MYEDLKRNKDKAFMLFTKVYVYTTNTKKLWNELTDKERNNEKFEWYCGKWFFISKTPMTEEKVKRHLKNCPELKESVDNIAKNTIKPDKGWKNKAEWYDIYDSFPLKDAHDLKLLINVIGLRMLHFED